MKPSTGPHNAVCQHGSKQTEMFPSALALLLHLSLVGNQRCSSVGQSQLVLLSTGYLGLSTWEWVCHLHTGPEHWFSFGNASFHSFIHPFKYPDVPLSIHPPICLSTCLSTHTPTHLSSIHLSSIHVLLIHPLIHPSLLSPIHPSIHPSSIQLSTHSSIHSSCIQIFSCPSIYPNIYSPIHLPPFIYTFIL